MIGKMYRPIKIKREKRGYSFSQKYTSNFGGVKHFSQNVFLSYQEKTHTEAIRVEISGIEIPIALSSEQFEKVTNKHSSEKKKGFALPMEKRPIGGRRLERPGIILTGEQVELFKGFKEAEKDGEESVIKTELSSRGDDLCFEMPIFPNGEGRGTDWFKIVMQPVVINNVEYMKVETSSETQVEITSNTNIEYVL